MSEANLEIVRRSVQGVIERNWPLALEALDPGIEFDQRRPSGVYTGKSGVMEAFARWSEAWEDRSVEAEEFIDGGDHIVVVMRESVKSARTTVTMGRTTVEVWTLRDGLVVRIQGYRDKSEALRAAGIAEARQS
jgi:ketosteroid isomerase-like protein